MDTSQGVTALATLMAPCAQYDFASEIATAEAGIVTLAGLGLGPGDAQYDQAVAEKAAAEVAFEALTNGCGCMGGVFDQLKKFTAPGLACAVVCFLLFIVNCCQCCALFRNKAQKVSP